MEQKHTPGPWEVSPLDGRTIHHQVGEWTAKDAGEFMPIGVPKWEGVATVMQRDPAVSAANAQLIAAAPDLLAACKALLGEGEAWMDGTMDHMPGVKIARLAIDKAEGRSEAVPNA